MDEARYAQHYSETSFWAKLARFATSAGREIVEKALCLYYAAQEPGVPVRVRVTIHAALGYFIFPFDAIPDALPVIGYVDDLGALTAALALCAAYITPAVRAKADSKLQDWFKAPRGS